MKRVASGPNWNNQWNNNNKKNACGSETGGLITLKQSQGDKLLLIAKAGGEGVSMLARMLMVQNQTLSTHWIKQYTMIPDACAFYMEAMFRG